MFAVVRTGGKQYKVSPDDVIVVERLAGDTGSTIQLEDVLMVSDGAKTTVGTPTVSGAKVAAQVVDQARGEKIVILKFKRRQRYRRTLGHRQEITVLRVTEISAPGMETARAAAKAERPKKAEAAEGATAEAAPRKTKSKRSAGKAEGAKKQAAKKAAAPKSAAMPKKPKKKPAAKAAGKGKSKSKKEA